MYKYFKIIANLIPGTLFALFALKNSTDEPFWFLCVFPAIFLYIGAMVNINDI